MRQEWRRLYRAEPPRLSCDSMMRALTYRIQEIAFGGLSKATLRRLATLAAEFESDGRIAAQAQPRIKPGARLVREWHGRTHAVVVTEDGFEFEGKVYRSLTSIAREITGVGAGPDDGLLRTRQRRPMPLEQLTFRSSSPIWTTSAPATSHNARRRRMRKPRERGEKLTLWRSSAYVISNA